MTETTSFILLQADIDIEDSIETLLDYPIAFCTSVDEAKKLADEINGVPLDWESDYDLTNEDENEFYWTAVCAFRVPDGFLRMNYVFRRFIIGFHGNPNRIMRVDWRLNWDYVHQNGLSKRNIPPETEHDDG